MRQDREIVVDLGSEEGMHNSASMLAFILSLPSAFLIPLVFLVCFQEA